MNENYNQFEPRQRRFLLSYQRNMGNVSQAAKRAGIPRRTFYNWRSTNPEFHEACAAIDESHLDLAESKLFKLIEADNERAIIYYLKTKGRSRGYG